MVKMIETERLILRSLTEHDANRIEELAKDYDVVRTTLSIPHPYPKGSAKDFIKRVDEEENKGKFIGLSVIEKKSTELIGVINLSLTTQHQRGELAYWIGKPYWNKGYGTEAAQAMVVYGFEKLLLNKIFAASFTSNPGSFRILEKIGMTYEGTLKQHVIREGNYYDLAYYGILKENFL